MRVRAVRMTAAAYTLPHDCPQCGCNRYETVRRATRWGKPVEKVRCDACGSEWTWTGDKPKAETKTESPNPAIIYHIMRCPKCGGNETHVTSTRRPTRHHKCKSCNHTFKSVEN